ncbi:MAG: diacylglycerol kinase family lipid kinase [Blautia sp.]|nr:diacylglycerol kinase family lipid kinase [Blautia sp.]
MYRFIINPNSRSGEGSKIWNRVKAVLDARSVSYEYAMTEYPGHACELAADFTREASDGNQICLVVLGGDGTIHEAMSGICDPENVIFGFIPAGSGNDFCRSMGLPNDPMDALELILTFGRPKKTDIPVIHYGREKSRFGISCGIGYDAAVCHEVLTSPLKKAFNRIKLGKLVYLIIALRQMVFTAPCKARLTMDGGREVKLNRMYFAAVMNQPYEGGGFRFCPDARPDDGLLDVIAVDSISKLRMLAILPTAFFGRHTHFRGIHIYKCRSIEIRCSHPFAVHIDGESGGVRRSISVSLEDVKLPIITDSK